MSYTSKVNLLIYVFTSFYLYRDEIRVYIAIATTRVSFVATSTLTVTIAGPPIYKWRSLSAEDRDNINFKSPSSTSESIGGWAARICMPLRISRVPVESPPLKHSWTHLQEKICVQNTQSELIKSRIKSRNLLGLCNILFIITVSINWVAISLLSLESLEIWYRSNCLIRSTDRLQLQRLSV